MSDEAYDLVVAGGGVNGAAIARDAAGRGYSVLLAEAGDLAGATSSASSKLVHGGLRYLEQYAFRLVRESLQERETLLRIAPHIVWPLRFILPHHQGLRPAFMLRAGLFIYDALAGPGRSLPGAAGLRLDRGALAGVLKPSFRNGFAYSDCWVEDARLVVLTAQDARNRGAKIRTRSRLVSARAEGAHWRIALQREDGGREEVSAPVLVNAAGPWVGGLLAAVGARSANRTPRLVKGSHVVTRRLHAGPEAFTFQNADGRIVFVLPFEDDYSLVGTTDIPFDGDPAQVRASTDEIDYLCAAVSAYLEAPLSPADVVWTFAGVRPLYDDGATDASAVTRDYVFNLEGGGAAPTLLSIYGGKLTTHRKLAEHALRDLAPHLPAAGRPWTATEPLPGGALPFGGLAGFLEDAAARHSWAPKAVLRRFARSYGTRLFDVIGDATGWDDMGPDLGAGLTAREIAYLRREEWATTADDILWRRTKLGLRLSADQQAAVAAHIARTAA